MEILMNYKVYKKIRLLLDKGVELYSDENFDEGIKYFEAVLEIDPNHTYGLQRVAHYYLLKEDYFRAKPLCLKLINQGTLANSQLNKLKRLAIEHNEPYKEFMLKQYIIKEKYAAIQRICHDSQELEKDIYLKMEQLFKNNGKPVSMNLYFYLIQNRINCEDFEEAKEYLETAKLTIKNYQDLDQYSSILKLYGESINNNEEHLRLVEDINELLQKNTENLDLLELLKNIYGYLALEPEKQEIAMQLKRLYEEKLKKTNHMVIGC